MKQQKKFATQEQQQVSEAQSQRMAEREFASVEELLRFDAQQTDVPPEVARRPEPIFAERAKRPAFMVAALVEKTLNLILGNDLP